MYTPSAFIERDLAQLDALFARDAFVTLVTTVADGLPTASHLPVLYRRAAEAFLIEGHWARTNPQATASNNALMIVHGPHHYVSASWYPDKEAAARVPTWNYAVAHLIGELEASTDTAFLADLVSRLSAQHQSQVHEQWSFDATQPENARQLKGIVGFRFKPRSVELKFKLSQNHAPANRAVVMTSLRRQDNEDAMTLAEWMSAREDSVA